MVLLVVDTQDMIVTQELHQYEQFVSNVKMLLRSARNSHIEVIYVRHDDGYELTKGITGFDIFPEFAPMPGEMIFDKHVNSAFKETGLVEYLATRKETQVMLVGLQTDYCIDATVKCGFEHGFDMIVPAYGNTTVDNEFMTGEQSYHYYNVKMWPQRYARCISLSDAMGMFQPNL